MGINSDNPCIYVANLGAYNAGRLIGGWLDLTTFKDEEELGIEVDKIANYKLVDQKYYIKNKILDSNHFAETWLAVLKDDSSKLFAPPC